MDVYGSLGIRPLINAVGTVTRLGGSLMPPEVLRAMATASEQYVDLNELHIAAGRRIAELLGVEAAYVSSGAAGGLAVAAAACIAGSDPEKIRKLPEGEGLKTEFVIQRSHRTGWEQALRVGGARMVEVAPTAGALRGGIGPRTAAVMFFMAYSKVDSVPLPEAVQIAHEGGVRIVVDAAAELPPMSNLTAFLDAGADLVIFSGGKGLRGPQASGLALGRRDLIEACRLNGNPNSGIGRPMKVGKEEIAGVVAAVERFVRLDHDAERRRWEAQVDRIVEVVYGLPGVRAERVLDRTGQIPVARVASDRMEPKAIAERLREGEPRIEVSASPDGVTVNPHMLREGDEKVIARRLREILR
ncbi:aminotransferase class V-fold PLP-dependent enzyme [bacterium]|nr:aminotransferase class V-fold PLP-dependent enzyme [bacterium]